MNLSDFCEVKEVGQRYANQLLAAGYPLLGIFHQSFEGNRRAPSPQGGGTFIKAGVVYVLGRTADQALFPAFVREP